MTPSPSSRDAMDADEVEVEVQPDDEQAKEEEPEQDGEQEQEEQQGEGEGEEEEEERRRRRKKKKKKSRKRRSETEAELLPELSDAERRELRLRQRTLHGDIDQSASMADVHLAREANNGLFGRVGHAREAVLDAENVDAIATKYVHHAEQLVQVPRYDALRLVQKLRSKCGSKEGGGGSNGGGSFNWLALGREAGICFNSVPDRVAFLAGPLEADRPVKERAKVQRQQQKHRMADVEEVKPEEVKEQATDDDKASAADRAMKIMKAKLDTKTKAAVDEGGGEKDIDGVKFLFNPKSFTQTVENIFHFSFLIKKGDAVIGVRSGVEEGKRPGLYVAPRSHIDVQEAKQAVLSFTMRDWRRLCKAYEVQECDLGHRRTKQQKGDHRILSQRE